MTKLWYQSLRRSLPLAISAHEERLRGIQATGLVDENRRRGRDVEIIRKMADEMMAGNGMSPWMAAKHICSSNPNFGTVNRVYEIVIKKSWTSERLTSGCPGENAVEP